MMLNNSIILIAVALVACLFTSAEPVESSPFSFNDCMKNPFASGCRGISAKRSAATFGRQQQQQQQQSPSGSDVSYYNALVEFLNSQRMTDDLLSRMEASAYLSNRLAADQMQPRAARALETLVGINSSNSNTADRD